MLARLLNVPGTPEDWSIWSFSNYDCNNQIRQAILAQKNVILPEYQLEPIPWGDLDTWMNNNQQAHIDFTGILGLQSNDLLHADLKDESQRAAWVWLNYSEVLWACQKLGIGP